MTASVDYAIDIMNSILGNISNENITALLEEAEAMLEEIKQRNFGPFENQTIQELEEANKSKYDNKTITVALSTDIKYRINCLFSGESRISPKKN